MQDKEVLEQAEEPSSEITNGSKGDNKDSVKETEEYHRKELTKDSKFAFRKMKQPKKEKGDKKSGLSFRGQGVSFKAKLIGLESVPNPRGDKLCQDAMSKLKMNVKNQGPHKRKINIFVSLAGIKIRDEKSGELLCHHSVGFISFISQDITDARAFGYVASSSDGQHQFIAIKTEKPAFHVVVALRDLFQTVLSLKQEKLEQAKEKEKKIEDQDAAISVGSDSSNENSSGQADPPSKEEEEGKSMKEENIYFDVILSEPFTINEADTSFSAVKEETKKTVDDLLCLQDEMNKLQQGIEQMDTSIAAATYTFAENPAGKDPFDTSFVTPAGPKDTLPQPMPAPVPVALSRPAATSSDNYASTQMYGDKYAVFSTLGNEPSVFENAALKETEQGTTRFGESTNPLPDLQDLEEEIKKKSPVPAKPPRNSKVSSPDLSVFADLDPLGKDRPYKDKKEFFQDVKNPPKKVLNDLLDKKCSSEDIFNSTFDANIGSPPVCFPVSPPEYAATHKQSLASSLPNSFLGNLKFSAFPQNGNVSPFNPFERENDSPPNDALVNGNGFSGTPPHQQFSFGSKSGESSHSSSPIPIPSRQQAFLEHRERAMSNGSISSSCSRSPCRNESSSHLDQVDTVGVSPGRLKLTNGFPNSHHEHNGVRSASSELNLNGNGHTAKNTMVNGSSKQCSQNGVSRPRPRPSTSKGSSVPSNGIVIPHIPSCSESEVIRKENMQSVANMLRTNGHRTRATSLPVENHKDYRIPYPAGKNIFGKKSDPFSDDFFSSLPKKTLHMVSSEIQEYV